MLPRVLSGRAVSDRRWLGRAHQGSIRAITIVCCLGLAAGCTQPRTAADDGGGPGVSGTETASGGDVQTGESVVYFPTWDAPENISTAAGLEAELVIGADNCLYLSAGSGEVILGVWPREFTWSSQPPGVRNSDGYVLQVGERFVGAFAQGSEEVESAQCTEADNVAYLWPPHGLASRD